jgi:tetratricopeptide (TPR) repeat protein
MAYQQLRQFPEAIQEFKKAWQQQPSLAYAPTAIASVFFATGRRQEAFQVLDEAARRFPQEPQVFEILLKFMRETEGTVDTTTSSYRGARSFLYKQRHGRTEQFLKTVEKLAQERGLLSQAKPLLEQGFRFLSEENVIQAEQQGVALCDRLNLGYWVTLGPQNQGSGLEQLDLAKRDGGTLAVADLGGSSGRQTQSSKKQSKIYFDVKNPHLPSHQVWVIVNYWDVSNSPLVVEYDSTDHNSWWEGKYKRTEAVWTGNTKTWQNYVFQLPDAEFQDGQHDVADFRFRSRGWGDTTVHSVRVLIAPSAPAASDTTGL